MGAMTALGLSPDPDPYWLCDYRQVLQFSDTTPRPLPSVKCV